MHNDAVAGDASPRVDVKIVLPAAGTIRIESARLFADPDGALCRRFVGRAFRAAEIDSAVIAGTATAEAVIPAIDLQFDATRHSACQVLEHVAAMMEAVPSCDPGVEVPSAATARRWTATRRASCSARCRR